MGHKKFICVGHISNEQMSLHVGHISLNGIMIVFYLLY
jgi:hypothetical protein